MNAISPIPEVTIDAEIGPMLRPRAERIMASATMSELVLFGRLFRAAMNCRPGYTDETADQMDEELSALITFDDELTERIAARDPATAEEYGVKVSHLIGLLRGGSMSDDVAEVALEALERDARAMAGLQPMAVPATATAEEDAHA